MNATCFVDELSPGKTRGIPQRSRHKFLTDADETRNAQH